MEIDCSCSEWWYNIIYWDRATSLICYFVVYICVPKCN